MLMHEKTCVIPILANEKRRFVMTSSVRRYIAGDTVANL